MKHANQWNRSIDGPYKQMEQISTGIHKQIDYICRWSKQNQKTWNRQAMEFENICTIPHDGIDKQRMGKQNVRCITAIMEHLNHTAATDKQMYHSSNGTLEPYSCYRQTDVSQQ